MKHNIYNFINFQDFILDYYQIRKAKNSSWSYSVWANTLKLKSPSTLIMLASGKRNPSPRLTEKLIDYFAFDLKQAEYFKQLVFIKKNANNIPLFLESMDSLKQNYPNIFKIISLQDFKKIHHWYFFAIRELVDTRAFINNIEWIQHQLMFKVSLVDIKRALFVLNNLGYIKTDGDTYTYAYGLIDTATKVKSITIQKYHQEILDLAKKAMTSVSIDKREFNGGCMTVNAEDIPLIKQKISAFKQDLMQTFGKASAESVYQIELLFFPLTRTKS